MIVLLTHEIAVPLGGHHDGILHRLVCSIGEADVSSNGISADLTASLSLGNGTSSIDGIRLLDCDENVLDTILYGDSSTVEEGWTDDQGSNPTSFAPEPSEGQSLGRLPNGRDTNNSASDIVSLSFASPPSPHLIIQS